MSNRMKLDDLLQASAGSISTLPVDQLAMLRDDIAAAEADLKAKKAKFADGLKLRYGSAAAAARKNAGKDTGTVSLADGGFKITADMPKKITWDQTELRHAVAKLKVWGEDPIHYVATEIKVSETKYNNWPPAVREVFQPARTVSAGAETFELTPAKDGK